MTHEEIDIAVAEACGDIKYGWGTISSAPRNATWLMVKMNDDSIRIAHWASDLSGDEQAPFEGWFVECASIMRGIPEPKQWRPFKKYHSDLNAIAEAETILNTKQKKNYVQYLYAILSLAAPTRYWSKYLFDSLWIYGHATALQRCTALLKTLNKWKD